MAGYSGDAGDAMAAAAVPSFRSNGGKFSTRDSDNDSWPADSCALDHDSGWWFLKCSASNVNKAPVGIWSMTFPAVFDVQFGRMVVKLN